MPITFFPQADPLLSHHGHMERNSAMPQIEGRLPIDLGSLRYMLPNLNYPSLLPAYTDE